MCPSLAPGPSSFLLNGQDSQHLAAGLLSSWAAAVAPSCFSPSVPAENRDRNPDRITWSPSSCPSQFPCRHFDTRKKQKNYGTRKETLLEVICTGWLGIENRLFLSGGRISILRNKRT